MFREYIKKALRTESNDYSDVIYRLSFVKCVRMLHAGFGLVTESAEILDNLKKHIFYGKAVDETNLKEELGDLMWYFAIACDALGFDFEEILECNIRKLEKRYGKKWNQHGALNRDVDKELEGF